MKNVKHLILSLVLIAFTMVSCESFLEEEILDEVSVDYIYNSGEGLEVGVNALYNRMRMYNSPEGDGTNLQANVFFLAATDLGLHRTWFTPYGSTEHTPARFPADKWNNAYNIIDRASAIITSARSVSMDETEKNKLVAQAKVIRGELYLDLVRMYGGIILDTTPTTPQNINDPIVYEVASEDAIFGVINQDLDFAIAHLDWQEPTGRYQQGVARHLKGKAAMWINDWEEAATQFDAIISNGTHSLVALNQVFGADANHAEALFVYQKNQSLGEGDDLAGGSGFWLGSVFNQRLYEKQSGSDAVAGGEIINDVAYGGQSLGWFFPNSYLESLYEKDNDLRYTTYYWPKEYTDYLVNNPAHPNFGQTITEPEDNYRRFHWSLKKYADFETKLPNSNESYKDLIYYRFAETLLLASEAHHNLGEDGVALSYINQIRRRGYGLDPNTAAPSIDFTSWTLDTYLEESARELAFENNRWFLLKRLGKLGERVSLYYRNGDNTGAEANDENNSATPWQSHFINCPVPQSQIDIMGENASQFNIGY
ncbi:RagB/SusD family nutrient uptake outer membrane protein [Cellulophaga sp. E16_2]|uniref:RagB/SusD domain-containing protein n=1 Tax=Cellulophaga algicola (strain DSM 14237 / IC166 / ACAM 630) TaxID=688270 RepID=E6X936_CELAD|nr:MULTISPECIES: RagB/SusD family nutrient uptake outer membrane protein [Cellulophaga]ADV50846.1 RagB/SusD domain-containing protein [Cellulophaga algicola DSM 14237]MBO0593240.1 RagB/SusD family nutrient uptake outer membrane protein [Cellulophaga sp. E16_2]